MRKIIFAAFLALLSFSALAETPPGVQGNVITNGGSNRWGAVTMPPSSLLGSTTTNNPTPIFPRNNLTLTTSGGNTYLDATSTGSAPQTINGTSPITAITTGSTTTIGLSTPLSITNGGTGAITAWGGFNALSSGIFIDPRAYGAKATGNYGISSAVLFNGGGSGFQVGDTFIYQDGNLEAHMRGGAIATGHVTSVNGSGAITGFTVDTPGSGYYFSALFITPTSGNGKNASVNITGLYTPPAAPSVTLVSGGNAGCSLTNSACGGAYRTGDIFALPNTNQDGDYATYRVSSVSNGVITGFTNNNPGAGYAIANGVQAITVTGYGSGATFNITSNTTQPANTWDDTYGIEKASWIAAQSGGAVLMPNNSWGANVMPYGGTSLVGQTWAANYGYADDPSVIATSASGGTHFFIIGTPAYGINLNNAGNAAYVGFEVRGYTGGNFGGGTTWDSTVCIGSKFGAGGGSQVGVPANFTTFQMSGKSCAVGFGSIDGTGSLIFWKDANSDWGANNIAGVYGPISDTVSINVSIPSVGTGMWLTASSGGGAMIIRPRIEYATTAFKFDNFGALHSTIVGPSVDRITGCAVSLTNTQGILVSGGIIQGAGLMGSLTVSGAANNGSGLIRLTVAGYGSNSAGGGTATSGLVTGDKANISAVGGTTEANANQWTITVIDGSHIDLQGSTFTNAYTSGGFVNVNGKGSQVCLNNSTDFHSSGVNYWGYSAGANVPAASIVDGVNSSNISFIGGTVAGGSGTTAGFRQAFANWHNSTNTPPTNTKIDIMGAPLFRNDSAVISYGINGNVGIGNAVPNASAALDVGTPTSAIIIPQGTSAQRPGTLAGTTSANAMIRYNSDNTAPEIKFGSNWNVLPSVTTGAPQPNALLVATTTGGYGAQWSTTGGLPSQGGNNGKYLTTDGSLASWASVTTTAAVQLGSSTTSANPAASGDATTGFYSPGAGQVAVTASGNETVLYNTTSSAVNYWVYNASATGVSPTITVAGTDTSGVGLGLAMNALTATATGVGGPVTFNSGGGFGTGAGGAIAFTSGTGATTGAGGAMTFTAGTGGANGAGGALTMQAGGGGASAGSGGALSFKSGKGNCSGCSGGSFTISSGDATVATGGSMNITGGSTTGDFTGGSINITAGGGPGGAAGGAVNINGGANTAAGGAAGALGGGAVNITGGTVSFGGAGGAVNITGSNGVGTNRNGGNVRIRAGAATGSGTPGTLTLQTAGATTVITIDGNKHVGYGGSAPSVVSCGTSPAIDAAATDSTGTVTAGSGTLASCTLNFNVAYATSVHCRVTPQTTGLVNFGYTPGLTALAVTASSMTGAVFDYACDGQ